VTVAPEPAHLPATHLNALTGIRGIAAWMVVLYHIRKSLDQLLPDWILLVFSKGYLAVDLFFMLSGFVLWYNYAAHMRDRSWATAGQFLWRRIARIWPLHLFVLSGFVALACVLTAIGGNTRSYPFTDLPLHAALIQGWGWTYALTWNHPAWSISTEMAAYLLFPLVGSLPFWQRLSGAVLVGLAGALLMAIHLLYASKGYPILDIDISRQGLWRCLLEFTLGNVLCMVWLRWRGSDRLRLAAALLGGLSVAAGYLLALPETAFAPLCFACLLLMVASAKGLPARLLGGSAFHYLGEISYSTYLGHVLLFTLYKFVFVDASMQLGWWALGGYLVLVLASSIVLYRRVEKPAQRWLNRHQPRFGQQKKEVPAA
jgi:peptidoglycan/LPS O-acetylase OafA/YrhL